MHTRGGSPLMRASSRRRYSFYRHRSGTASRIPSCTPVCKIERLEPRQLMSTYYVNTHGNDGATGTSVAHAWRSIDRVNKQVLKAGDLVLFRAGSTYSGSLYLPSKEGGTAAKPVVFSTYGRGRATILSGSKPGIDVAQTAGVAVTNFN